MMLTLIALISIVMGIIGANAAGLIYRKFTFGYIGNSIAGVFGSIFMVKSLGRLGFDPQSIMQSGSINLPLFALNAILSFFAGAIALFVISKIKNRMV